MKTRLTVPYSISLSALLVLLWAAFAGAQQQPETSHHRFRDADHWAHVFESPEREQWQKPDEVIRALGLKRGQTVADIGAGTGYFTRRLAKAVAPGGTAWGLDIEPEMVDYMRRDAKRRGLANYRARLVKADDPGLKPGSVDLIFICDAYHHIDNHVAYLKNLLPSLRPAGRVALVDFKEGKLPVGPVAHKVPREQALREFETAGYHLVKEYNFLPYQYFLVFESAGEWRS